MYVTARTRDRVVVLAPAIQLGEPRSSGALSSPRACLLISVLHRCLTSQALSLGVSSAPWRDLIRGMVRQLASDAEHGTLRRRIVGHGVNTHLLYARCR